FSPFEPGAGSVAFRLFSDNECRDWTAVEETHDREGRGDGIRSQGKATDTVDVFNVVQCLEKEPPCQIRAFRVKGGLFSVKVKVALRSGRQHNISFFIGFFKNDLLQFL